MAATSPTTGALRIEQVMSMIGCGGARTVAVRDAEAGFGPRQPLVEMIHQVADARRDDEGARRMSELLPH